MGRVVGRREAERAEEERIGGGSHPDVPRAADAAAVQSAAAGAEPAMAAIGEAAPAAAATSLRAWLRIVGDGFRGRGGDPTRGPVGPAIVLLAVPMVLEMVMESVFSVVDIFFVSRLGAAAMASVALTESMMAIVYTLAAGLSIGVTAVVARRTGGGDPEAASVAAGQALLLGVAVSVLLGVGGGLAAPRLLAVMGADADVVATGTGYARIMLAGNGAVLLLFMLNAAFRGAGDAAIAMRVLWLANGINIVLDPCLIFGLGPFPEMGVTGAAVATVTGRGTAVLVQLYTLFRLGGRLKVGLRHLAVRADVMARVVRLSSTGTLQTFIATASWIGLVRILAGFGPEALAGYAIAVRIVLFALLPAWGLANAAATMVGQGLGAGDPDRAERAVWLAGHMNLAFLGSVAVAILALAPAIVGPFGGDAQVTGYAVNGLRIVAAGYFFYAYGMVLTQSFNGAGDTWTPTILNFACFWLWEIPLAWVLGRTLGMGPEGVFLSITVALSTLAVLSAVLFRRGTWKKAVV